MLSSALRRSTAPRMALTRALAVGESVPAVTFKTPDGSGGQKDVKADALFNNRTVVLFGVPGAFTPVCQEKHVPSFVDNMAALKKAGVDEVCCLATNDAFVMGAWSKELGGAPGVTMLSDGNLEWLQQAQLTLDLSVAGLGLRANRFAAIVKDGRVEHVAVEEPGQFRVSSGEAVLDALAK